MDSILAITILSDKSSWMSSYNLELKTTLQQLGHKVTIIHSDSEIEQGDILFILSFSKVLKKSFLALNNHNIVVHASDLPKGRGMSPMSWQILEGSQNIPISLFEAVEKLDEGDIYIKDVINLSGYELSDEWRSMLGCKTIELCLKFVKRYPDILKSSVKQIGEKSFYKRRTREDSELDINRTIKEQFNLLRIVANSSYPAFFIIDGKKYIITINSDTSSSTNLN